MKLGHQAPKNLRTNKFNSIELRGDFAYCKSHNFIYSPDIEEEKLYNAEACYYTDKRFIDGRHNFYHDAHIHWTRWKDISLKACIRKTLNCKNIPLGTIVDFKKSCYAVSNKGKAIGLGYKFKIKKENKLDISYEINLDSYSNQFTNCEFSKELTTALRNNGFIVSVESNSSHLTNMLNTAIRLTGGETVDAKIDGEVAIAYGYGKKIGFSSFDNDLFGYYDGKENILWDKFGEFDKWSRCNWISKNSSIDDIISKLKS
jgi:hypothetical protein